MTTTKDPFDLTEIANRLMGISLSSMIPLLSLWKLEMTDDPSVPNAQYEYHKVTGICKIRISNSWAKEWIRSPEEMVTVLLHECLHPLLGFVDTWDPYLGEAWEILINQLICVQLQGRSSYLGILRRLFEKKEFPTNFRCDRGKPDTYFRRKVYRCLYNYDPPGNIPNLDIEQTELSTRYDMVVPLLCATIDPQSLADFLFHETPDEKKLPRTKEDWQKEVGAGFEIKAGSGIPGNHPLLVILKDMKEGGFGQSTFGDPQVVLDEEGLESSVPDDIAEGVLSDIEKALKKDILKYFPNTGIPRKNPRINEYKRKFSKNDFIKITNKLKTFTGSDGSMLYAARHEDMRKALDLKAGDSALGGSASRYGGLPILYRVKKIKAARVKRQKLLQEIRPLATLSEQGRIKCLLKAWTSRIPDYLPAPSFQKDRRATSLLLQGRASLRYRQNGSPDNKGLTHVYVDASGSVTDCLPDFISFLNGIKIWIADPIHIFSTEVYDILKDQVLKDGAVKTTGGTTFSCIVKHMLQKGIRNALVFTDGYLSCTEAELALAQKHKLRFVTLLTPKYAKESQLYTLSHCTASISLFVDKQKGIE